MVIAVKIGSVTESKTVKRASESYTAGGGGGGSVLILIPVLAIY